MNNESLLLGELREFKRASLARFDAIEKKVDTFQEFRMKLIGMSAIMSFLTSILITVIIEWYRR